MLFNAVWFMFRLFLMGFLAYFYVRWANFSPKHLHVFFSLTYGLTFQSLALPNALLVFISLKMKYEIKLDHLLLHDDYIINQYFDKSISYLGAVIQTLLVFWLEYTGFCAMTLLTTSVTWSSLSRISVDFPGNGTDLR